MKKILIINGPNINLIGTRETELYGTKTYDDLCKELQDYADKLQVYIDIFQSNYEGKIIDKIQDAYKKYDGIVINAAAFTHTSIAILDALKAVNIKTIEVHLTDITKREDYRKVSFISEFATKTICGKGFLGYFEALEIIAGNEEK